MMFKNSKDRWSCIYEDSYYKIYDWDKNLTGYFFPLYQVSDDSDDDRIIQKMNEDHEEIHKGYFMLPFIKINLYNNQELDIRRIYENFVDNLERIKKWMVWIDRKKDYFNIVNNMISPSREDLNMLSITFFINENYILKEKEILEKLKPILNDLHDNKLL